MPKYGKETILERFANAVSYVTNSGVASFRPAQKYGEKT
jgi:hypothetical protein